MPLDRFLMSAQQNTHLLQSAAAMRWTDSALPKSWSDHVAAVCAEMHSQQGARTAVASVLAPWNGPGSLLCHSVELALRQLAQRGALGLRQQGCAQRLTSACESSLLLRGCGRQQLCSAESCGRYGLQTCADLCRLLLAHAS